MNHVWPLEKTVFCVADGMGGGSEGATASRIVCEEVEKAVANAQNLVERMRSVVTAICHVGDSRIYRVRRGTATLLTHDHTIGGQLSDYVLALMDGQPIPEVLSLRCAFKPGDTFPVRG